MQLIQSQIFWRSSVELTLAADAFEALPTDTLKGVRAYQVHLKTDNTWIFKILTSVPLPSKIAQTLHSKWEDSLTDYDGKLLVQRVDSLKTSINRKLATFTSDYDEKPRNLDASEIGGQYSE